MGLTFGSLFAGIGGIDLGFERAGMVCKWQVEKDEFCNRVLEKHWPDVQRFGDVKDVGRKDLETVDVITGGFPCQPHSLTGKRRGAADDRNLWPEFARIITELRPRWVVAENVPGIIYTYLDTVLSDLEGMGYTSGVLGIPAAGFDAPHRRERIFIVAHSGIEGLERHTGDGNNSEGRSEEVGYTSEDGLRSREGGDVAHAQGQSIGAGHDEGEQEGQRRRRSGDSGGTLGTWPPEPSVGRVAHGVPDRMDRLKSLGNAVVPQVAEFVALQIIEVERQITQGETS